MLATVSDDGQQTTCIKTQYQPPTTEGRKGAREEGDAASAEPISDNNCAACTHSCSLKRAHTFPRKTKPNKAAACYECN